jgi:uncharacterized protein (DUF1778 family)
MNKIILSKKESKNLAETLINPPAPNEELKRSLNRYREVVDEKSREAKNI